MRLGDGANLVACLLTSLYGVDGSITGETFNRAGKTDILVKYQSEAVFVAECKIWSGVKDYLAAIDQLLKYLTWRNSRTAILLLVKNRDLTQVIASVREATEKHANYVRALPDASPTWLNYAIRLKDDRTREANMAVMLFSVPSELD